MPDEVGAKRQRVAEEDYFRKKDQELVERMRAAAAADQARRELGARTGLTDPALLAELQELRFTPETIVLLPLVPVVQMAWAEGGVTPAERSMVMALARKRGIEAGTAADRHLSEWLAVRPDANIFEGATRLIAAMLATSAEAAAALNADDVIKSAEAIASASGGLLGIAKVSAEERAILSQLQTTLRSRKR